MVSLPEKFFAGGIFGHPTPLGKGLHKLDAILSKVSGRTAVSIFSDGRNTDDTDPVEEARQLHDRHDVAPDPHQERLGLGVAETAVELEHLDLVALDPFRSRPRDEFSQSRAMTFLTQRDSTRRVFPARTCLLLPRRCREW